MKDNLITQPTRHNLRYPDPVKRLRPFQNPTKEDALPSLETQTKETPMSNSQPDLQLIDRWEVIRMLGISLSTLERKQVEEEHFPSPRRRHTALSRACKARSVVMRDCTSHPTTRLENRSMTTDRYDQPSCVRI